MSDSIRKKQSNPYEHIRRKNSVEWYLYWLCEDDEFKKDMKNYAEFYEDLFQNDNLSSDESKPGTELMESIIAKYHISEDDFDFIQTGLHLQIALDFPFTIIENDDESEDVIISIPRKISNSEYIRGWSDLKDILKPEHNRAKFETKTRKRPPEDTRLIYAIHKARLRGRTFRNIFKDYQNGLLDSYIGGPTNQYSSEDSLERYYRKYKPDI